MHSFFESAGGEGYRAPVTMYGLPDTEEGSTDSIRLLLEVEDDSKR